MPNLWKVQYGPGSTVAHKYIYNIVCTSPLYIVELIRGGGGVLGIYIGGGVPWHTKKGGS